MKYPSIFVWSCILWCATLVVAGGPVIDGNIDLEPNDVCQDATMIDMDGIGTALIVGAEIGNGPMGAGDVDLFQFGIPSHSAIYLLTARLTAINDSFDGYLRLFEEDDSCQEFTEIRRADDSGASLNPVLREYVIQPAPLNHNFWYTIAVSHARNQGYRSNDCCSPPMGFEADTSPYVLSIEVERALDPVNSIEPNDDTPTLIEAVPVTLTNQFIGDGPNGRDDVDRYEVMLDGPSIVTAEVIPTQLAILDPVLNGIPDHSRPDLRIARSTYVVYGDPSVEIVVSDPYSKTTGFYNLSIDVQPITSDEADGPHEPNDSILRATETGIDGFGKTTIAAFIGDGKYRDTRGDADYFRVVVDDGQLLFIDLVPTNEEDPVFTGVHLFNPLAARMEWWPADENGEIHASYKPPPMSADETAYFLLVSGAGGRIPMDPLVPKASYEPDEDLEPFQHADQGLDGGPGDTGAYELTITVTAIPIITPEFEPDGPFVPSDIAGEPTEGRLFAIPGDDFSDVILEFDSATGNVIHELPAPEVPMSSSTGLAFDGEVLFAVGAGRYPSLYVLSADTGEILNQTILWFGSGWFGDIAVLGDWLYVVDMIGDEIYRMSTSLDHAIRRLNISDIAAFSPAGPIAVSGFPPRLYITNAHDRTEVLVLNEVGDPIQIRALEIPCPCDADFDGDGDIDDDDRAHLEDCYTTEDGFPVFECESTDLNCDDAVNELDEDVLICQQIGPDNPPHVDCCFDDFPPISVRATSLTAQRHSLVAGDWAEAAIYRFGTIDQGQLLGRQDINRPATAIAGGWLTVFGDADQDLDLDILDWGGFQDCFELPMSYTPTDPCAVFDWDFDGDVDLFDHRMLQTLLNPEGVK